MAENLQESSGMFFKYLTNYLSGVGERFMLFAHMPDAFPGDDNTYRASNILEALLEENGVKTEPFQRVGSTSIRGQGALLYDPLPDSSKPAVLEFFYEENGERTGVDIRLLGPVEGIKDEKDREDTLKEYDPIIRAIIRYISLAKDGRMDHITLERSAKLMVDAQ